MSIYDAIARGTDVGSGINAFAQGKYMVAQDQQARKDYDTQNAFARQAQDRKLKDQYLKEAAMAYANTGNMEQALSMLDTRSKEYGWAPADRQQVPRLIEGLASGMARQGDEYGLAPVYFTDAEGNTQIAQTSKAGGIRPVDVPAGWKPSPANLMAVNQGSQILLADPRTGAAVGSYGVGLKPGETPAAAYNQAAAKGQADIDVRQGDPDEDAKRRKRDLENQREENALREEQEKIKKGKSAKADIANLVDEILTDGAYVSAFGTFQGSSLSPNLRQSVVDADAKINRLVDKLTLENMGIMTGVLTDRDMEVLRRAGTLLSNRRIGDKEAERELRRIAEVLTQAAAAQPDQAENSAAAQKPATMPEDEYAAKLRALGIPK